MNDPDELKSFYVYVKKYCPRRSLDSSRFYRYLIANGLVPVADPKEADLIFIFTCGGFALDEEFSILTIEKSLKNKGAKIIVTGCLPKIDPNRLKAYGNDVLIIPVQDLGKIDSLINAKVPYGKCPNVSLVDPGVHDLYHGGYVRRIKRNFGSYSNFIRTCSFYVSQKLLHRAVNPFSDPKTYKLVIAEGCLGNCSYCAIKLAMVKFHSFPEEQIVENFKSGLRAGYRTFALLAGDIGCYGIDIKTNLPDLLKKLFEVDGDYRVLLVDLNARWFVKYYQEFLSVLKENSKKVSGIIMPIQSGSDRILRLMNRHYRVDEVKSCILDLQKNIPGILIQTHIIVGFPGETDDDFEKSVRLLKEVPFSKVLVYKYEERPGTAAISLPGKVAKNIAEKRERMLRKEIGVNIEN